MMKSRKTKLISETNTLLEKRYLEKKFLMEQEDKEIPKLQVMPIKRKIGKYKISLFQKKKNENLTDIMTPELLNKLNLKKEYANQESAILDIEKIYPSDLENII
jgi:hypothetical protein